MNSSKNEINTLFNLLDNWRNLPAYQLERRSDIFFALYLDKIIKHEFGDEISKIIPEFPLRKMDIDPIKFETFSKNLLKAYGFKNLAVTPARKDGGIDGHGKLKLGIAYLNVAFECKRWKTTSVGRPEISRFRGDIQGEYEQGIFITTSTFTKDAISAATKKGAVPIALIDGKTIVEIMIEKGFGVDIKELPLYINTLPEVLE